MKRRNLWLIAGSAFLLVVLAIFRSMPRNDSPARERITIAYARAPECALVMVAGGRGYFQEEGLDAVLLPFRAGRTAMEAMLRGEAQFATATETPLTLGIMNREPLAAIAGVATSERNVGVVARRDAGIHEPRDLRGKKTGVTLSNNTQFFLYTLLIVEGLPAEEVPIVFLPPDGLTQALLDGTLDAVSIWEPYLLLLQNALGNNSVTFYAGDLYTETFITMTTKDFAAAHPAAVAAFVRALKKAEEFVASEPVAAREIVAKATGWDRALLDEIWGNYRFRVGLDQSLLITMENLARWAIATELTSRSDVPNFLDSINFDGLQTVSPDRITIEH